MVHVAGGEEHQTGQSDGIRAKPATSGHHRQRFTHPNLYAACFSSDRRSPPIAELRFDATRHTIIESRLMVLQ